MVMLAALFLFTGCSSPPPDLYPKAAIIDQLYVLKPNQAFIDRTTEDLEAYGFKVDIYQGDEVTVDFYRKLAEYGYKLIIFRVHSGILGVRQGSGIKITEGTWLFTNEVYNAAKYPREQLTGQMGMARINENYPWVFAVGSEFVSQSIKGEFPNTVIIMMGCSSLYLDDLPQAFIQKGASVYLGWQATVDLSYDDETTASLVQRLSAEQLTVEQAVTGTMAEKGPDPAWGAMLKYYPAESGNQTVKELIE